jgi:putative phage-type endonuclease
MLKSATITKQETKEKACRPLFDVRKASYEHWLLARRQYITGTDAGTIAGVNKYQTPYHLYMEKKGLIKREPANSAMIWGKRMEPVIRQAYAEETGYEVKEIPYMLVSTKYPWMAGNLDGAVRLPSGEWAVLEIKNLGPHTGYTEYANGDSAGYASPSHVLQCYHYSTLVGCRKAVLCACISGQKLVHQIIEYDQETANALIALEQDFYYNKLKCSIPPPVTSAENDLLAQLYPKAEKKEIQLPESAGQLIESYDAACRDLKEAEQRKAAAEASLKDLMREASVGIWNDRIVKWAETSSRRISSVELKKILTPEQIETCTTQTTYRRFSISKTK